LDGQYWSISIRPATAPVSGRWQDFYFRVTGY
jgi:hypothetical protein